MFRRTTGYAVVLLMTHFACGGCGGSGPGLTTPPSKNTPQISNAPKAVPAGDRAREIDPLVALLKTRFAAELKRGGPLIIADETDVSELIVPDGSFNDLVNELKRQASEQVPADLIKDFCEKTLIDTRYGQRLVCACHCGYSVARKAP